MSRSRQLSALALGIALSAVLHALVGVMLARTSAVPAPSADEAPLMVDFDVNEPPPPEEADMPELEQPAAAPPPAPPAESEVEAPPEMPAEPPELPAEVPPVEPEEAAAGLIDAGVPDAGVADAGVPDAGAQEGSNPLLAVIDASTADGAAATAAAPTIDAGAAAAVNAATASAANIDAGAVATASAASIDAGAAIASPTATAAAEGSADGGERHPGSQANLLTYAPVGEVVSVMIRFDRLRGTPWAKQAEAILAPMPDYRTLIGTRQVSISTLFETLVVSSSDPQDVTATTLAGHTAMSSKKARAFVNHRAAPVAWSAARGGALGQRKRSPLVAPNDERVFLMPFPGWMVLAHPRHLGVLTQPPISPSADIDTVAAAPAELPTWLARIPGIEAEAGPDPDKGPALVITTANMLPPVITVRSAGQVPMPQRLSMALEVTRGGFFVRGTMLFASADTAASFVAKAEKTRTELMNSRLGKILLARMHAYNALRGLSLKQNGAKVGYATSISVSDAEAMMDRAAEFSQRLFAPPQAPEPPRPAQPEAPANPAAPAEQPAPANPAAPAPARPAPGPSAG